VTGGFKETIRRDVTQNVPKMFGEAAPETIFGHQWGPVVDQILGVVILVIGGVMLLRRRVLWGLWIACTVLMMLTVLPTNAILPRYLLPVLPLLVYGWWLAIVWLNKNLPRPWDWIFVILFIVTLTINGVKIGDVIREQRRTPFLAGYKNGRYLPTQDLARAIRDHVGDDAFVLAESKEGRILSYFSGRRVVEAFELPNLRVKAQPLFVVEPMDAMLREFMSQRGLHPGETLATVMRPGADVEPYTLHRVTAAAPAATTQPNLLGDASR
jgi:hypothetical protein